jgi:hypothetical protein
MVLLLACKASYSSVLSPIASYACVVRTKEREERACHAFPRAVLSSPPFMPSSIYSLLSLACASEKSFYPGVVNACDTKFEMRRELRGTLNPTKLAANDICAIFSTLVLQFLRFTVLFRYYNMTCYIIMQTLTYLHNNV